MHYMAVFRASKADIETFRQDRYARCLDGIKRIIDLGADMDSIWCNGPRCMPDWRAAVSSGSEISVKVTEVWSATYELNGSGRTNGALLQIHGRRPNMEFAV
jgi:hypothetical protein